MSGHQNRQTEITTLYILKDTTISNFRILSGLAHILQTFIKERISGQFSSTVFALPLILLILYSSFFIFSYFFVSIFSCFFLFYVFSFYMFMYCPCLLGSTALYCTCFGQFVQCTVHVQGSLCSVLMFRVVCDVYCTWLGQFVQCTHVQCSLCSVLYMFRVICVVYCTCLGQFVQSTVLVYGQFVYYTHVW